jgi:catechol 2,3-dioxygenase-like lactoylglutathione lyase family enzyme
MDAKDAVTRKSTTDAEVLAQQGSSGLLRFTRAKGMALAMGLFDRWVRLRHRLRFGIRVRRLDHITIPCRNLAVAEAFYVGVLGARVMLRVNADFLRRMGRAADAEAGAIHTSVVFDGGSRVDLFIQQDGQPPAAAGHPHYAFAVSPGDMLAWKARLNRHGIPTFGPTRLGPPSQASLYFNDPFGNHLELVTIGFVPDIPVGAPDTAALEYSVWKAGT